MITVTAETPTIVTPKELPNRKVVYKAEVEVDKESTKD
jgi:hypothetical protein